MASGIIKGTSVEVINEYLRVRKNGNIVTVDVLTREITGGYEGWHSLGSLPAQYRPTYVINGLLADNFVTTDANNNPIDVRITTGGTVNIYLFADKLRVQPFGTITYII